MARSGRDLSPDDERQPTTRPPFPERPLEDDISLPSGRAGTGDGSQASQDHLLNPADPRLAHPDRPASARNPYPERERDRTYTLRDSELRTLADVGTFRAVTLQDLTRYRYSGNSDQAHRDLNNLARQGLIRLRTTYPGRSVYITLTRESHHFIDAHRPDQLNHHQALYHGFAKPREAKHDTALYRLYQQEFERITRHGGKVNRIVLDFELKKSINRKLAKLGSLPESDRTQHKQEIAQEHGLTVVNGKILLPDLRIEYETRDQEQTKVDLELVSAHYHGQGLAAKARAGFAMFALTDEAARLRPAMLDPEIMQDILSL